MGVREMDRFLEQWEMNARDLHRRMILSPTLRERERWYSLWLLAQGWTASATAEALERDPPTIVRWAAVFGEGGPAALIFEQSGGPPPRRDATGGFEGSGSGIAWRSGHRVGQLELEGSAAVCPGAFGISLSRSTCLNYLHRLGFVLKCPKKRLVKADEGKREAFVSDTPPCGTRRTSPEPRYSSPTRPISGPMRNCGANGCCGESRPWWTRAARPMAKRPATTRRCAWRAGRWSGWSWMELEGNSNSGTSGLFLRQLRERHAGPLQVIWDNAPARRGGAGIPRDTRLGTAAGESAGLQP